MRLGFLTCLCGVCMCVASGYGGADLLTASSYLRFVATTKENYRLQVSAQEKMLFSAFTQDSHHRSQILLEDGMPVRHSRVFS